MKIVRTNRQPNLRASCQSIFSLFRHHPTSEGVEFSPWILSNKILIAIPKIKKKIVEDPFFQSRFWPQIHCKSQHPIGCPAPLHQLGCFRVAQRLATQPKPPHVAHTDSHSTHTHPRMRQPTCFAAMCLVVLVATSALLPTAHAYGEPVNGVPTYWERTGSALLNAARVGSCRASPPPKTA